MAHFGLLFGVCALDNLGPHSEMFASCAGGIRATTRGINKNNLRKSDKSASSACRSSKIKVQSRKLTGKF